MLKKQIFLFKDASGKAISYARGLTYVFKDGIMDTAQRSYYLQDEHNNVTYMVNEGGVVVNAYDYDAFGNAVFTLETGTSNAIRYTSEYQNPESGLYYLRARYYNPETGRFISEDSYRASKENPFRLNLYTYCHNDPINFVDPSGHWELGDEELSKKAQNKIKRLTDEYFGTNDKEKQKKIQEEANAIRESEKNKKRSSRSNEDSFSRKINDKIKNSSRNDGTKNYIVADTWKQVSREEERRTGGEARYNGRYGWKEEAAEDVIKYIEREVKTVGDYESDIKKYTDKFSGTQREKVETVNLLVDMFVKSGPHLGIQESESILVQGYPHPRETGKLQTVNNTAYPYMEPKEKWEYEDEFSSITDHASLIHKNVEGTSEGASEFSSTLPWYQNNGLRYELNMGSSDVEIPSFVDIVDGKLEKQVDFWTAIILYNNPNISYEDANLMAETVAAANLSVITEGMLGSLSKARNITKETGNLGKLTKIGDNAWESSAGLIYGADKKFGNRVKHVLAHGTPNPSKASHTVFNVGGDEILGLVDEAWTMKGNPLANDPGAYLIDMGRTIGTNGETTIKVIVKPGTSEIITAYPVK